MSKLSVNRQAFERMERFSRLLDSAFFVPGTDFKIGLDALIGLIPGVGDLGGMVLSSLLIVEAARLGVPVQGLVVMIGNVLLETLVGVVPVAGDLFDATWKSNLRNMDVVRHHLQPEDSVAAPEALELSGLVGAVIVLLGSLMGAMALLLRGFFGLVQELLGRKTQA